MPSKFEAKKTYQHFVPAVKKDPDWYKKYNFVLVTSLEQLERVFRDCNWSPGNSFISFDTETTGLNFEELDIVGYSFCIDGVSCYYVPINHFEYEHNLGFSACEYIYNRMCEAKLVFMYNARYDIRVMEYIGYKEQKDEFDSKRKLFANLDMSKVNVFDVMNSVFLSDTNDKLPSLKDSSLRFLGYEQMHFDEVIEGAGNFYYLNPSENSDTVYYAAADALCTYLLAGTTHKYYQEAGMAGKLDNMVIYPLLHSECEKIWLDKDKLKSMYEECSSEVIRLEQDVYQAFGFQLNLNSPAQVANALERLGIDTGERTSSGNMATGMSVLERLPEDLRNKFPALDSFMKYKEMVKLQSSYFKVYLKEAEEKGYVRAAYKLHGVPTGRFAGGKDGKNSYFSPVNIQAMPKPHVKMYDVYDLGDKYRNCFSKKNNVIMGYVFSPAEYDSDGKHIVPTDPKYIGWAEGMNPELNLRDCLTPKMFKDSNEDEWVTVACDYAAQELRLTANMSHEPTWENAFAEGRDVHKSTAIALWGEENYNKDYRKMAKGVNFCECPENLVLTQNRGYIPAKDVVESDVLVGKDGKSVIVGIEKIGNQECVELQFSSGLKASYHKMHKLLCWDGKEIKWVRVKDLDDSVQVITMLDKTNNITRVPNIINTGVYFTKVNKNARIMFDVDINDPKFAYLMGAYVGDGHLDMRNGLAHSFSICASTYDGYDKFLKNVLIKLGVPEEYISIGVNSRSGKTCNVTVHGIGFARLVAEYFGTPNNKFVSDYVFSNWDRACMLAFISGYIDTDGTNSNIVVSVSSSQINLLNSLALMCNYLGYRTSIGRFYTPKLFSKGVGSILNVHGEKYKIASTLNIYNFERSLLFKRYKGSKQGRKAEGKSWLAGDKESRYDNFIYKVRNSDFYMSGSDKKLDNYLGNLRDGHTGITERFIKKAEELGCSLPLKSQWYPSTVVSKKEFVGNIVAIECDTHEYISMSMNSHNSVIYGASAASFVDPVYHISTLAEAEEFYDNYKSKLPTLFQWIDIKQRQGRKRGTVYTYFGRPRRVKGYFDNGNFSFANRTIINTQIQGTASDILKLVLVRLWRNLLNNPKYRDDVKFMDTIHDEIQYGVHTSKLNEIVGIIEDNQTLKLAEWRVPIITEASIGWTPGSLFAWERHYTKEDLSEWYYTPKLD